MNDNEIYKKISVISKIILVVFCIILFKVWHLGIIQKEKRQKDAIKPQRRVVIQKANRGIICDRNDTALAVNRIKYNATVYYSHIRELPHVKYEKDSSGKKIKRYIRKEYITNLCDFLGKELGLDPVRIEDIIYSKASILPHIPYVIKENISEEKYYKLRIQQRDWPGLYAEISQERFYPFHKVGADIIGYMGQISQREYFKIADEIKSLQSLTQKYDDKEGLPQLEQYTDIQQVKDRLDKLNRLAYRATDLVGKSSIEKIFDEKLKGFHEKKTFAVDIKGHFLKELDGFKKPQNGQKLYLTISQELQTLAENLLIQDEKIREGHSKIYVPQKKQSEEQKQPLAKGGAIIAMDPNTGEVLACASYPRFDPNDFISSSNIHIHQKKQRNINKWLETATHIANIFDGMEKLTREYYLNDYITEERDLSFEQFQDLILSKTSHIKKALSKIHNIKNAITLQENVEALLYFSKAKNTKALFDAIFSKKLEEEHEIILKNIKEHSTYLLPLQKKVESFLSGISDNRDKIFTVDLCRMIIFSSLFADELINKAGSISLSDYWKLTKCFIRIKNILKLHMKPIFHDIYFKKWREENEKTFLKAKRLEEKEKNTYAHPYIDLLDNFENKLFNEFWQKNYALFTTHILKENVYDPELNEYFECIKTLDKAVFQDDLDFIQYKLSNLDTASIFNLIKTARSFHELERPLLYNYPRLRSSNGKKLEKHLAASFYPKSGFAYSRSYAISNSSPPGSIFKIIIAYTALKQRYNYLIDNHRNLINLNPLSMIDDIYWDAKVKKGGGIVVGKTLDGKSYPRHYKRGRLPRSAHKGIGKIDLIRAIEVSSNPYFSILAGDYINSPYDLINCAKDFNIGSKTNINLLGETSGNLPEDIIFNKTSLYSFAIGQHSLVVTPIQTAIMLSAIANKGKILKPKLVKSEGTIITRTIEMPEEIRHMLLDGLDRVVSSPDGGARPNSIRYLRQNRKLLEDYKNSYHDFVGKTSTAEFMYNPNINPSSKAEKYKNIWFGAISFEKSQNNENKKQIWEKPELVLVVELNYGSGGKEAAPLAFQIVQKYRELKERNKM